MQKAKFEISGHKERFRNGIYSITDVSSDPTWQDVRAIESHRDDKGRFTGTVNHRERDFEAACAALVNLGAKEMKCMDCDIPACNCGAQHPRAL